VTQQIYCIHDACANAYLKLMFSPNQGLILRSLVDELSRPDSDFLRHPDDYTLFLMGEWDDVTGDIKPLTTPKKIGRINEFIPNNTPSTESDRDSEETVTKQ
jgi:hypothetical protein